MRTHKIVFRCDSKECADWYEKEVLHVDFCDMTHWFCGLDGAGEDTPDKCIIYRGIVHPEMITVELDISMLDEDHDKAIKTLQETYHPCELAYGKHYVVEVIITETDAYAELKESQRKMHDQLVGIWPNKHF